MSIRKCATSLLSVSALLFLIGCGGSGSPHAVPPPSGAFSNSDLNGTYTFSTLGFDSGGFFFAIAGSFQADGNGGIKGGALDINDPGIGTATDQPISPGGYNVTADGRGTTTLNTSVGNIGFDFVLSSSSHGLITRFDTGGSGSGTLDLQGTVAIAGPYTFSVSGVDASGAATLTEVGSFTVSGSTITGVADVNDNKFAFPDVTLSGSIALGTGTAPGVATLTTSFGSFTFDVYTVDSTHLKFIETDVAPVLIGDAFTQQTAIPSGQLVFTAAGLDSTNAPMALGGSMSSDGSSVIFNGLEDVNDAGNVSPAQLTFAGSFTPVSGGRSVFTLTTFDNGITGTFTFAAYPSSSGIQLVEIDNAGNTAGAAFAQTATSLGTPQGYAFNLSGSNSGGFEEDDIAEFTASNGALTGIFDVNDEGGLTPNQAFSGGAYAPDSVNDGRGVINTSNFVNGLYYIVDGSNVLFLETDGNQVGLGAAGLQSSSAQVALKMAHFATVRTKGSPRAAWQHKK